jgi:hypothetical protein
MYGSECLRLTMRIIQANKEQREKLKQLDADAEYVQVSARQHHEVGHLSLS